MRWPLKLYGEMIFVNFWRIDLKEVGIEVSTIQSEFFTIEMLDSQVVIRFALRDPLEEI